MVVSHSKLHLPRHKDALKDPTLCADAANAALQNQLEQFLQLVILCLKVKKRVQLTLICLLILHLQEGVLFLSLIGGFHLLCD